MTRQTFFEYSNALEALHEFQCQANEVWLYLDRGLGKWAVEVK